MSERIRTFLLLKFHSYRIVEKGAINIFGNFIQSRLRGKLQNEAYESELFLKLASNDIGDQFTKTKEILNDMNFYLNSRKIKFVVVIIPLDYQVDENLRQSFIKNNYNQDQEFDIEQPQKIINDWALQNNVDVIDLLPELRALDDDLYWKLNAHFNVKGNEAVGAIIYGELIEKGLI
jgi:hypothetical protein